MVPLAHLFRISSGEDLRDLVNAEIDAALFAQAIDTREKLLRFDRPVVSFAWRQTVITGAAVLSAKFFTKVTQHRDPAALGTLSQLHDLAQLLPRNFAFLRLGHFVDEPRVLDRVARAEEQKAFTRQSVAAGAPGFLVEAFDVLRQIVMHDEAHVRFIDAHAKRNRSAN